MEYTKFHRLQEILLGKSIIQKHFPYKKNAFEVYAMENVVLCNQSIENYIYIQLQIVENYQKLQMQIKSSFSCRNVDGHMEKLQNLQFFETLVAPPPIIQCNKQAMAKWGINNCAKPTKQDLTCFSPWNNHNNHPNTTRTALFPFQHPK